MERARVSRRSWGNDFVIRRRKASYLKFGGHDRTFSQALSYSRLGPRLNDVDLEIMLVPNRVGVDRRSFAQNDESDVLWFFLRFVLAGVRLTHAAIQVPAKSINVGVDSVGIELSLVFDVKIRECTVDLSHHSLAYSDTYIAW